ncbi:MAG: hypothetical protein HC831_18680 [Chloroflexia bacterium]|nr:hypothetical protein [Chloroflexia bacterium]
MIDEALPPTKDNLLLNFERSFFTSDDKALQISPYITGNINIGKFSNRIVLGTDYSYLNNYSFLVSLLPTHFSRHRSSILSFLQ